MGYHNNEETTKKAIRDANRFINDRSRLEHALRLALKGLGIADSGPQETIISEVKSANFDSIYRVAQEQNNKNITSMLQQKIDEHNQECIDTCGDKGRCDEYREAVGKPEIVELDAGAHYRKYYKGIELDPYRIAKIYGITDHMQFFILKKGLKAGGRGHKDLRRDIEDIKNACDRWLRTLDEDS
jgi:hypothetical protein